jgi:hypothetical protein
MPDTPVPDLPQPSAELILLLALVQAHVRTLSRKDRAMFLAEVHTALGMQEAAYGILRFRPRSADPAIYESMRQAQAWWRQATAAVLRLAE